MTDPSFSCVVLYCIVLWCGQTTNEHLMYHLDAYWDSDARLLTLVLPYCAGGELFDRILAVKFFSEVKAATLFRKLASGVAALHRIGVVHRNIKPENILL